MAVLSWMLFTWLHQQGRLDIRAGRKAISAELKQMKKAAKADKKAAGKQAGTAAKRSFVELLQMDAASADQAEQNADLIYQRWMWFGGGFYGLAALWTFVIVEIFDVLGFFYNFPGFAALWEQGIISLLVQFVVNQIVNIFSAFIWFTYWSDSSNLIWVAVAYLGYLCGLEFAKRQIGEKG